MAHCGYEPTAAQAAVDHPLSALWTSVRGVRTTGPMAPEIPLSGQRPAEFVFSGHVAEMLAEIERKPPARRAPAPREA